MPTIGWEDFQRVELRVGRVIAARSFPEARKPAYVLEVDFGPEIGVRRSSAQITDLYTPDTLVDRLVVAVNDDGSVSRLKGPGRPINSVDRRMAVLAGLEAVDWVVCFAEDTPENLLAQVRPDVLVKGGDYVEAVEAAVGQLR